MWNRTSFVTKNLSLRISLLAVLSMATLLFAALLVMFFYSKKSMREDALNRASQTLNGANVRIDNILLSVEETTGNIFYLLQPHLKNPDSVVAYSRKVMEVNPYVTGCAIAMKPGFYADRPDFMTYFHREVKDGKTLVVRSDSFGDKHYTEQSWFTKPMAAFQPMWLNPLVDMDVDMEPIISFCLPIVGDDEQPQGVISVDVSLSLLSDIINKTKPSPNSYCALLDRDGSFVVHPLGKHLMTVSVPDMGKMNESVKNVADAMMSGETGYLPFSINGRDYYVFYKPFERAFVPNRSMERLSWSVGVAMSKEDIFGDYNHLFNYVLVIAFGGLLLMFVLSWMIIYLRLEPLKMLTDKIERIAQGHYYEAIPDTKNKDEIGSLQRNFQRMQLSLALNVAELQQLTTTANKRGEELKDAYKEAKKSENLRTVFMHNMTNQMVAPAVAIDDDVTALHKIGDKKHGPDVAMLADRIQQKGEAITKLLNNLLNQSEKEMRKEVEHEND